MCCLVVGWRAEGRDELAGEAKWELAVASGCGAKEPEGDGWAMRGGQRQRNDVGRREIESVSHSVQALTCAGQVLQLPPFSEMKSSPQPVVRIRLKPLPLKHLHNSLVINIPTPDPQLWPSPTVKIHLCLLQDPAGAHPEQRGGRPGGHLATLEHEAGGAQEGGFGPVARDDV